MKFLKLLSIPAMVAGVLALATVTASANHATITAALNCDSTTASKVCFDLTISTVDFDQNEHDLTVTLLAHKKGDAPNTFTAVSTAQVLKNLPNGLNDKVFQVCFPDVAASNFDSFKLSLSGTGFDINGQSEASLGPIGNSCAVASPSPSPSPSTRTSPSPTPSPSGSGSGSGSPTPTPSANTTAVLAQTGGFDFRFPLIGLGLLVAGGALYIVSASRGRASSSK